MRLQRFVTIDRIICNASFPATIWLSLLAVLTAFSGISHATDLMLVTESNYDTVVPPGKEVDAIYGDLILRNDFLVAVIAQPKPGRKANMTVRGVAGMIIDLTQRLDGSDQLSCFYPAAGRYLFEDSSSYSVVVDGRSRSLREILAAAKDDGKLASGNVIKIAMSGLPINGDGTRAAVTYALSRNDLSVNYAVGIENQSQETRTLRVEDSLRCDGNLFTFGTDKDSGVFYAQDLYFGQCYGFLSSAGPIERGNGRNIPLRPRDSGPQQVPPGETLNWEGKVSCAQGLPGIKSWATTSPQKLHDYRLYLKSPTRPVAGALVTISKDNKTLGSLRTIEQGRLMTRLPNGQYRANIVALGYEDRDIEFEINNGPSADTLSYPPGTLVRAKIVDDKGEPIAAKVQFLGIDGTATPDFGPDSAISAVKNVVYCAKGAFEQPIQPGKYQVIVSHGTEYDASFTELTVEQGRVATISESLKRSVSTPGWVSTEFHSHSTPSGDNVSHQRGRVLNLLAEHLEFAPCTEHNRVDTYADDLEALGAAEDMATCTGMELTGSPLPVNHQNAFPIHRHPHTQDGGGPDTDVNPVAQIERLALWDDASSKVVQTNHPNLPQILGDADLDGKPDDGFRGMLGWMDVIEVHPPEGIFDFPEATISPNDKRKNPMFFWLQLLNLGYRIPGVVNTDAHYNFHGSGWLRNYLQSSTDLPSEIALEEMIHSSEHGHVVMTTGPYLRTEVRVGKSDGTIEPYISGEDLALPPEGSSLWMQVQCPNWFDVNRVQVFANGAPLPDMNFTRRTHPQHFADGSVRFELSVDLPKFTVDTHLIVATIGEGLELGPVMGPDRGKLPPVAVANPIFIDVDGGGFQANGDNLGVPFQLPPVPTAIEAGSK